jgi:putative ABC transport system permease protein
VRALDRKLLRDLRQIWAQTLAIALVLGCGIMLMVGAQGTQRSLEQTRAAYYERFRFADIFAQASRAPRALLAEIGAIDGVARAEGRITFNAVLDIAGMDEPATAQVLSLPADGVPVLNVPLLRTGRMPDPDRPEEVLINEPFGEAHDLVPGSQFAGVFDGQLRELTVTGWVLSPEFVYTLAPGAVMPDDRRFGLIWMSEAAAASASGMQAAVNDIALTLTRDADARAVIAALDRLLDPYGGTGAYGRDRQGSHSFLDSELEQLGGLARFMPPVFLIVAAFLVNMVLGRLIAIERPQIGLMRAVGYTRAEVAAHYLKLAALIGVLGVVIGWLAGWWIGNAMLALYGEFFRFPFLLRDPSAAAVAVSAALGLAAVLLGAMRAVLAALRLPPAEAMSPPAPPVFTRGWLDELLAAIRLRQTTMMIFRSIIRWPGRAAITLFGVSASVAVLVSSYFLFDAMEVVTDRTFGQGNRQQITLTLNHAQPLAVLDDAMALPGVRRVEGAFAVPVRLVNGHRDRLSALQGHFEGAELARLMDDISGAVPLPAEGVVLPALLARALGVEVGEAIRIELLAAPREVLELPVAAIVHQSLGQEAHIAAPALFAALRLAPQVNQLHLLVDSDHLAALNAQIKRTPSVAGLADWGEVRRQFDETMGENLLTMVAIYTIIGVLITIGVVYNAARIQLSERSHELASLRVMGFTRAEVGFVLVGEMMLLTLLAIPLGWLLGNWFAAGVVAAVSTDVVQLPYVISRRTYAAAAAAVFLASLSAALLVRRRLDRVDLNTALKARQ